MSERFACGPGSKHSANLGTFSKSLLLAVGIAALMISGQAIARPASAQVPPTAPDMGKVSGAFSDPIVGYSITFPPGWSGFRFIGNGPVVIAGGVENMSTFKLNQSAAIMVLPVNRSVLADFASLRSQMSGSSVTSMQNSAKYCSDVQSSYTTINGMSAFHAKGTCNIPTNSATSPYMTGFVKLEIVMVATKSHLIMMFYYAFSQDADSKYYGGFTQSLTTFRVNDTVDFRTAQDELSGSKTTVQQIQGNDSQPVNVSVTSNSKVSGLSLDTQTRSVSFSVDSSGNQTNGVSGVTRVQVDSVLQGPYTVSIDGNTTQSFQETKDDTTGQTFLTIGYPASTHHSVVIAGTQIVPEFPVATIPLAAAMLSVIFLLGRSRAKSS